MRTSIRSWLMLLQEIELFLKTHRMPPARFGREVLGDPSFVFRLKKGRVARSITVSKVQAYSLSTRT